MPDPNTTDTAMLPRLDEGSGAHWQPSQDLGSLAVSLDAPAGQPDWMREQVQWTAEADRLDHEATWLRDQALKLTYRMDDARRGDERYLDADAATVTAFVQLAEMLRRDAYNARRTAARTRPQQGRHA